MSKDTVVKFEKPGGEKDLRQFAGRSLPDTRAGLLLAGRPIRGERNTVRSGLEPDGHSAYHRVG